MPIISIYNNKGGVGKSTLTVGLAEFLAADGNKEVLIIDLDAQASSSGAILDRRAINQAIENKHTFASVAEQAIRSRRIISNLSTYITVRPASSSRSTPLQKLNVLVPDKSEMIRIEESMRGERDLLALSDFFRPALDRFAYVLIDFPGNIDSRNKLAVGAMAMSDFTVIPVEPSSIALNALPDTFEFVEHCRRLVRNGRPEILGLILNKTDRRTDQYKNRFCPILEAAQNGEIPEVFENMIPDAPKLATSTDEMKDFHTRKERFDTYYDPVRKVARELEERCARFRPRRAKSDEPTSRWFRNLFDSWRLRRQQPRSSRATASTRTHKPT
jgi:chromosome partitioning protein